jgi:uncharacterized membrane protein YuzA (DUF378 family)
VKYEGNVRASYLDWISLALVIVGAINWGLVGVGSFLGTNLNVVDLVFGSILALEAFVYLLVGLAGLYDLYFAYQLYGAREPAQATKRSA